MTNNRNIREIALLKPDYMGFVFHKSSPRDVSETIGSLELSAVPPSVKKVAVTVDRPIDEVREIIKKHRFDAIQLHGDEDPEYCRELMQECLVIKAFRINDRLPSELGQYMDNCNIFLFDAKGKHKGGNGIKFNHEILKGYHLDKPFILSGGIGCEDAGYLQAIDLRWLAGVDLNSRFELSPGYKSLLPLKVFINKIRSNVRVDR
jgi:phosphoribosylanthranilate isomerase